MFEKISARTKHYAQDIYDFASELIRLESLSGDEGRVAKCVEAKMQELNFDSVTVDDMGNVCGTIGHGSKLICVDGHMDVVGTGDESHWSREPLSGDQDNEYIYGRGAADMKSALSSMIYAGKVIQDLALTNGLTYMVCASVQEEPCEGLAWEYMIEERNLSPEFVILAEPSNDEISLAQKGRLELKIYVSGKSAHASTPHLGDNAIYKMASIVKELEELSHNFEIEDAELGKGCLVVSEISSNAASRCSVADYCEVSIDRRLTWGESPEYALEQISNLPSVQAANARIELYTFTEPSYTGRTCNKECIFPAWKLKKDHAVTTASVQAYEALFGKKASLTTWPFSTNGVAIMGKHGIPVIGYGPGTLDACHVADEYVSKQQVLHAAMMYAAIATNYTKNTL